MSFVPSTRPDITESIPGVISARMAGAAFRNSGTAFDVAIGDIPFLLACSEQRPFQRQTASWKKQQFDTSKEPGEQTLNEGYWLRSQNSWHHGSGINFYEPTADPDTEFRSTLSMGVDPWTLGQVTLQHSVDKLATATTSCYVAGAVVAGVDTFFANTDGTLSRRAASVTTPYTGSTSLVGPPVIGGGHVYVGANAQMYSGLTTGTTVASMTYTGATGTLQPYWVKSRLMATNGPSVYQLNLAGGVDISTSSWSYTHPDAGWTWTSMTETVDAILAAGYSDGYGAIYRFSLTDSGSGTVPKLGQAFQIAEFPSGEQVYAIKAYLGKFIAIGTSLGVRIGVITGATSISPTVIQYGPLSVKSTKPVTCLTARDSFIYAGITSDLDGNSGAVRISLQEEVSQGSLRFPWAYDAQIHANETVQSIAIYGSSSRVVLGTNLGRYSQSSTFYEPTGYVLSGKVRYDTTEPKAFRLARIRSQLPALTSVGLSTVAANGSEEFIINLSSISNDSDVTIARPEGKFEYLSFKLTLNADPTLTAFPALESFTVKAVPAPARQEEFQIPLQCYNLEKDRYAQDYGASGGTFARDRFLALKGLENSSAIVGFQDFTTGESIQVQIEQISLQRITKPKRGSDNFGGIVTLTLRAL